MSPVYPTLPRLSVRDSFEDDELSDVDDEVFIRDGKNGGLKIDDEGGVKRPLMAPRRKCKANNRSSDKRRLTCKAVIAPCCYASLALLVLIGLITLVIFAVSVFPVPITFFKNWLASGRETPRLPDVAACTSLAASTVWTRSLPKLTSETPLRSLDANGDNIQDIVLAFSTGLNDLDAPQYVCNVFFGGQTPCLAGILALDGATGETVWTHWSRHMIFALDCSMDFNSDGVKDCVAAGRGGTLRAVNGRDGKVMWSLPLESPEKSERQRVLDVYDGNCIADIDGDEVGDVVAAHTIQIGSNRSSYVVFVSGKTGKVINRVEVGSKEQLFLAPLTLVHPDGEKILVFVTGSNEQPGGLYVASFADLLMGEIKLQALYYDAEKGVLTQPILVDITGDGTEDIVAGMFKSSIMAFDGRTFERIWSYAIPNSEVISSPIPGYYNDDDVPDFMVKHQLGPGYPVYYYSAATVLDGKSGKPLLEKELEDSISGQMSGLSVTVDGYGNDWFLHWSSDCLNHEGDRSPYQFLKGTSLDSRMGADLCKLRFNSSLTTKFLAFSQHTAPPGLPIYDSDKWRKLEYNSSIDPRKEAEKYSEMHPDYEAVSSITERSLGVHPGRRGRPSDAENENDPFSDQTNRFSGSNFKERKDSNGETNVSEDFGSNDDFRDGSHGWDSILYDEGEAYATDSDKASGLREQRSDEISAEIVNKDTNQPKNELDSSLDYTNGQSEDSANNRTTNVKDFDFDESLDEKRERRKIVEFEGKRSQGMGQEEVAVGNQQNSQRFLKISKRPAVNVIEANFKEEKTSFTADINKTRNVSEVETIGVGNFTEKEEALVVNKSNTKDFWSMRDGFDNEEEDANIEKIFKRESMKNRKINKLKTKLKRETVPIDPTYQTENFDGVQRQPPTGILLPSLKKLGEVSNSVDLVFLTFWLPPSDASVILLQQDLDCIHRKRKEGLKSSKNQQQRSQLVFECLGERGMDYKILEEGTDRENVKIPLGQMTIYRMKLECVCPDDMPKGQTCRSVTKEQSWPANLGPSNNGYFRPLRREDS